MQLTLLYIRRAFQRSGHHWFPSGDHGEDTTGQGLYTALDDLNITLQAHFISRLLFTRYFLLLLDVSYFFILSIQSNKYSLSRMVQRGRRFLQTVTS